MSQPSNPQGPLANARELLAGLAAAGGRLGPRLWGAIAIAAVLLIGLAVWATALVTPVTRTGQPTASVAPLPAPTTATPTPSGTPGGTPSATATPSSGEQPKLPKLKSSGKFDTAAVKVPAVSTSGDLRRYSVRVETTAKLKVDAVARQIAGVLNDPRSWTGSGGVRFSLVSDPEKADFSITLGSRGTAAKLCEPDAAGSCTDSADVVIDAARWAVAPADYAAGKTGWQAYLVNHGMGQLLGERREECSKKGQPAPVMMPQAGDLGGCTPNPWPYP